jgi:hypothetical protein
MKRRSRAGVWIIGDGISIPFIAAGIPTNTAAAYEILAASCSAILLLSTAAGMHG